MALNSEYIPPEHFFFFLVCGCIHTPCLTTCLKPAGETCFNSQQKHHHTPAAMRRLGAETSVGGLPSTTIGFKVAATAALSWFETVWVETMEAQQQKLMTLDGLLDKGCMRPTKSMLRWHAPRFLVINVNFISYK